MRSPGKITPKWNISSKQNWENNNENVWNIYLPYAQQTLEQIDHSVSPTNDMFCQMNQMLYNYH